MPWLLTRRHALRLRHLPRFLDDVWLCGFRCVGSVFEALPSAARLLQSTAVPSEEKTEAGRLAPKTLSSTHSPVRMGSMDVLFQ